MQYIDFSSVIKIENFQCILFYIFLIFAQNIDCGYPQSMFLSKSKKNRYTPAYYYIKVGFKGVFNTRIGFPDV